MGEKIFLLELATWGRGYSYPLPLPIVLLVRPDIKKVQLARVGFPDLGELQGNCN